MGSTQTPPTATVFAAGAVLWRRVGADVEIALVHRPRYDDWTLPKGKIDPGETAIVAAVREVAEETGLQCRLGRKLSRVAYRMPGNGKRKVVDYWAGAALEGEFTPNSEVDELRWVPVADAAAALSYEMDRSVLVEFLRLPADTTALLVVRHASAGSRSRFRGDDRLRPLDKTGRMQAAALVPQLLAFGATDLHAADRVRCAQTVEPLAAVLDTEIHSEPSLSEEGYAADPEAALDRCRKLAADNGIRAICSQGKVIPDLLERWAAEAGLTLPRTRNRKASMWVLSLDGARLVAADHVASPLPPDE